MAYDDDFYSILNSLAGNTTTTTEQETEKQTTTPTYSAPTTSYNPWADDDDYSLNQNYEEQQSYNSSNPTYSTDTTTSSNADVFEVRPMAAPMIQKEAPAVNLIKKRQRIELGARMKIAVAMFVMIVASLLVAIVWNFASAASMKATFAEKQIEINALTESIIGLKETYAEVSDDEQIKIDAKNEGYVDATDENTIVVDFSSYYTEPVVEELPSNWFNDVCEFFAKLFA